MHHQFANQELARLSHVEAIRNSRRQHHVVDEPEERVPRSRSLVGRIREAVADVLAPVPEPRTSN